MPTDHRLAISFQGLWKDIYEKLNLFFETIFQFVWTSFEVLHALSNLLFNWQDCLDKSGVVGTILMDLSKVFDCLPYDLI